MLLRLCISAERKAAGVPAGGILPVELFMGVSTIAHSHCGHGRFTPIRCERVRTQGTPCLALQLAQFSHAAKL